jgi:hypothetical protein
MTYFRDYSPRRDDNEPEIIAVFEAVKWFVIRAGDIDLFVNDEWGEWFAVEVKMPKGRMKKHQMKIQERCGNTYIARSTLDAQAIIQDRRDRQSRKWNGHVPVH